jgi:hypothetical protein
VMLLRAFGRARSEGYAASTLLLQMQLSQVSKRNAPMKFP